jgi:ribosome-associated translation inhibitor RaiA
VADMQTLQIQTGARGAVPDGAMGFAVQRITSLLRAVSEPVLFARVKLIVSADPAVERPATAQFTIDLNGRLVRVHAAGKTMREATDHARDRLRIRLERAERSWASIRGSQPSPGPGEWRHRSEPVKTA